MKYSVRNSIQALIICALLTALGACSKESNKGSAGKTDSTLVGKTVKDSSDYSDYVAPEELVARAYSISKFSELRSLCNQGYVFVTLTPDSVIPSSASASMENIDLHWSEARILAFDSSAIQFKPPRMNFADKAKGVYDPASQILRQTVGHTVTVEVIPLEINLYIETLLVQENQTIIALGFIQL